MSEILNKINELAWVKDQVSDEQVHKYDIKPGLRNADGTGVIAGITSIGAVLGKQKCEQPDGSVSIEPVEGRLTYCGYDAVELAEAIHNEGRFGYEEVVYLLLTGELPRADDLSQFIETLKERTGLTCAEQSVLMQEAQNDNQMFALHAVISHLSRCDIDPDSISICDVTERCLNIIAKMPAIVAWNYQASAFSKGSDLMLLRPEKDLSMAENFLYMLTGKRPDEYEALLFDLALILHAEHGGGNNSTFTVRCVSSSGANTYMAICSGIASLSGHLHGGANEAVVGMMSTMKERLKDSLSRKSVESYIDKLLDKQAGDRSGKVYGMGHAVYTLSDPRAVILKEKARELAYKKGREKDLELYEMVEEISTRKLEERRGKPICANVDFYSGFVYEMLGIPVELFTPVFAMSRVAGWSAHRIEQIIQDKIIRPGYISSLAAENPYVALKDR